MARYINRVSTSPSDRCGTESVILGGEYLIGSWSVRFCLLRIRHIRWEMFVRVLECEVLFIANRRNSRIEDDRVVVLLVSRCARVV